MEASPVTGADYGANSGCWIWRKPTGKTGSFFLYSSYSKEGYYMKLYTLLAFMFLAVAAHSQTNLNNYKYVLVPERFDCQKEDNQYALNTITKMLLEDKGFVAIMGSDQTPPEVAANKCNALKAELVQKKGIFVTNLSLVLKDC